MDEEFFKTLEQRSRVEPFGRLLGLDVVNVGLGYATIRMRVTDRLQNIFQSVHGGAIFSLVDEAFQLACNTHGVMAVALNVSITYVSAPDPDSILEATAEEIYRTNRTASYACRVMEPNTGKLLATAQALAYRTQKKIAPDEKETP